MAVEPKTGVWWCGSVGEYDVESMQGEVRQQVELAHLSAHRLHGDAGNAVKYIGEGKQTPRQILIHIECRDALVRVEVQDTGPGLPPGSERIVFGPFRRMTGTDQPGIGLGLANVKKLVEAYKGRVGVISTYGCGSTSAFGLFPGADMGKTRQNFGKCAIRHNLGASYVG